MRARGTPAFLSRIVVRFCRLLAIGGLAGSAFAASEAVSAGLTLEGVCCATEGGFDQASVRIPAASASAVTVRLTSDKPEVTVPATVTIAAGATSANFTITVANDTRRDGGYYAQITASADTFTPATARFTVYENDPSLYEFNTPDDIVDVGKPIAIRIYPLTESRTIIDHVSETVNLYVILPDGSRRPLSPPSVTLSPHSGWHTVTVPSVAAAPLRLRIEDANGITGESEPFDAMRVLPFPAGDLQWDAVRSRIYASIPSGGGNESHNVIAIDPATLQITGRALTGHNPQQLALTSGAEVLYAALEANGSVTRIDPATMSVTSSFSLQADDTSDKVTASDIAAAAGQPSVLVVGRKTSYTHLGVAAYDNGVMRPAQVRHLGTRIEPSADPTIFFGYNDRTSGFQFSRLKLNSGGMTESGPSDSSLISGFFVDIASSGDTVVSTKGDAVDGAIMRRVGAFGTEGVPRPDVALGRVYFIEPYGAYDAYARMAAFDSSTRSLVRRLQMPAVKLPGSLIRWGSNGLAFKTSNSIVFVNSSKLVPSPLPADLRVDIQASPNPVTVRNTLTYSVRLTNTGPNVARDAEMTVTVSPEQYLQSASADRGGVYRDDESVRLSTGDLAPGETAMLTVRTIPTAAGRSWLAATATAASFDPNPANNAGTLHVPVTFRADTVNALRLAANNLIYDPVRGVLWATLPQSDTQAASVVSIQPMNGLVSDPIPIGANPQRRCIALSGNGRFLYVGLANTGELLRLDLTTTPYTSTRIPLGPDPYGGARIPRDIEVLEGDGTSVIVGFEVGGAVVYDGAVRRSFAAGVDQIDAIEKTSDPNVFVAHQACNNLVRLSVSPAGVSITQSNSALVNSCSFDSLDLSGAANLTLTSEGRLIDSSNLALRSSLGVTGRPCLDLPNGRAYIATGDKLNAFDISNGSPVGSLVLSSVPASDTGKCIRWGLDGFAILRENGPIYIARWSSTIPPTTDADGDLISDAWEAAHFGTLSFSPWDDNDGDGLTTGFEYLFATSPLQTNASPVQIRTARGDGDTFIHLTFPRRQQRTAATYGYEVSTDLAEWVPAEGATETILGTAMVDGVAVEIVDAAIPAPANDRAFARLRWLGP